MDIQQLITVGVALVCVGCGFIMGRASQRPDDPVLFNRNPDQGSTDEPEADMWQDAMTDRVETIK